MTTPDIIAALANCSHTELKEIREALDARTAELKAAVMAQAEELGMDCLDNGGKRRKRKTSKAE